MLTVQAALDDIRQKIAVGNHVLAEARNRREYVLGAARTFDGTLRTFRSGSIAHGTANGPGARPGSVCDADCGIVLDRRTHPNLGPDGEGEGPLRALEELRYLIREEVRRNYPEVRFHIGKRAIKVTFNSSVNGAEPTVDLVMALRREEQGLWIPNTEKGCWDASDPERHTELLVAPNKPTQSTFARAIRLAKAWNQQYSKPALNSFNIEALALASIAEITSLPEALGTLFEHATRDIRKHRTPDPAGVSDPISLPLDREIAVKRLEGARDSFTAAMEADSDDEILRHLSAVFYNFIEAPDDGSKESIASTLRRTNDSKHFVAPVTKPTRAHGRFHR